jgi:hypothetical protein
LARSNHSWEEEAAMNRLHATITAAIAALLPVMVLAESIPGDWTTAAPLPEARTEVSVASDGERLYLLGGFAPSETERASAPLAVFAYDPAADDWSHLTDLPEGVNHAGLAYLDGALHVVGGYREATFEAVDHLRIYDLEADRWQDGPPLPTARGALAVAVHDGRIHAIGGVDAAGDNTGAHEIYDPASESWTAAADLPTPRDHIGAAAVDGEIVVLAGRDATSHELTVNEIYDVAADAWRTGADVPTGRSGVAVVEQGGRVYLFGGETFSPRRTFDEAERYDPAADSWAILPPMPTARHGLGAGVLDGRIHVVSGGPEAGFAFSDAHEVLVLDD